LVCALWLKQAVLERLVILLAPGSRGPTGDLILDPGRYGPDIAAIDRAETLKGATGQPLHPWLCTDESPQSAPRILPNKRKGPGLLCALDPTTISTCLPSRGWSYARWLRCAMPVLSVLGSSVNVGD